MRVNFAEKVLSPLFCQIKSLYCHAKRRRNARKVQNHSFEHVRVSVILIKLSVSYCALLKKFLLGCENFDVFPSN